MFDFTAWFSCARGCGAEREDPRAGQGIVDRTQVPSWGERCRGVEEVIVYVVKSKG